PSGNYSIIRSFTRQPVDEFPGIGEPFSAFVVLTDAVGEAEAELVVTWFGESEIGEYARARAKVVFPDKLHQLQYKFRFDRFPFPGRGEFLFTLYLNGYWMAQRSAIVAGVPEGSQIMNESEREEDDARQPVFYEFTDDGMEYLTPLQPIRAESIPHLPSHLLDSLAARGIAAAQPYEERNLADCLWEQAALLNVLKHFSDAAPRAAEAAALFERLGDYRRLADCFRVAADVHRELGEVEIALEFRRREEELRRRLAA